MPRHVAVNEFELMASQRFGRDSFETRSTAYAHPCRALLHSWLAVSKWDKLRARRGAGTFRMTALVRDMADRHVPGPQPQRHDSDV